MSGSSRGAITPDGASGASVSQVGAWLRANLFRSRVDSAVTIVVGGLGLYVAFRLLRFVFVTGRWEIARVNLSLFVTGVWPQDQMWRLVLAVLAVAGIGGSIAGYIARAREVAAGVDARPVATQDRFRSLASRLWPLALGVVVLLSLTETFGPTLLVVAAIATAVAGRWLGAHLLRGAPGPLAVVVLFIGLGVVWLMANGVGLESWGGVVLNVFLAAFSITICFPIGVVLALGRRSSFPILRLLSTAYIELFRGVPLIALLLMADVALGFFIPQSLAPSDPVRAIVVFVLFTAAYLAEVVRGGLQAVPRGQVEAAKALGLSPISTTFRIVLPQALRAVIPAIVGQFISLFKDTTLAGAAMSLPDLLNAAQASTAQDAFQNQGLIIEVLVFVLFLFWVGSYTMSRESQRLESRLGVGER